MIYPNVPELNLSLLALGDQDKKCDHYQTVPCAFLQFYQFLILSLVVALTTLTLILSFSLHFI